MIHHLKRGTSLLKQQAEENQVAMAAALQEQNAQAEKVMGEPASSDGS